MKKTYCDFCEKETSMNGSTMGTAKIIIMWHIQNSSSQDTFDACIPCADEIWEMIKKKSKGDSKKVPQ